MPPLRVPTSLFLLAVGLTPVPLDAASARIEEARLLAAEESEIRIVGGVQVPLDQRPWQVALVLPEEGDDFRAQFCGGSLVAPEWVLTANHCVDQGTVPAEVEVLYGSAHLDGSGDRMAVHRIVLHEPWDPTTKDGDLALLRLAGAIRTRPAVTLASAHQLAAASTLDVSGWGRTAELFGLRSEHLLAVRLPLVAQADCRQPDSYGDRITEAMFCAGRVQGGQDSCRGDSGGPATVEVDGEARLAGVVSWGSGCGRAKKYGVYTRVPTFEGWIRETIASGSDLPGPGMR